MSNHYSLEDLRNELDRQYAPFILDLGDEEVTLRNILRLPKKDREIVLKAVEELNVDEETQNVADIEKGLETLTLILETVADKGKGKKVTAAFGDDLMLGMRIFELWMEATQPGEVSNSPDSSTSAASA